MPMTLTERLLVSDALYDAKRSKKIYESSDDQYNKLWDGSNKSKNYQRALRLLLSTAGVNDPRENVTPNEIDKHMEAGGRVDPEYQSCVRRHVLSCAVIRDVHRSETGNQHKSRRNSAVEIDKDERDSDEDDPQYKAFIDCLKEHGNSYALKDENHGSPRFLAYEEESSSDNTCELVRRRKISSGVLEPIQGMTQHRHPRTSVNLGLTGIKKDKNVGLRGKNKLDSRARNEGDYNVEDDDSVDFILTTSDSEKYIELEYSSEEDKHDSDADYKEDELSSSDGDIPMNRPGCSEWADNLLKSRKLRSPQMEFEGDFLLREKAMLRDQTRNQEKSVKGKEVLKGYYESNKKAVVLKNKGQSCMRRSPRFNLVTEGPSKNVVDEEHLCQEELMKAIKGKNVVLQDTTFNDEETVESREMLKKMFKRGKMVAEPKRRSAVRLTSQHARQKHGPSMNCVDRGQPDKEESAESRNKSKIEVKEENPIQKGKKKISENDIDYDDTSDDMEILDSAAVLEEGQYSSFVPSKIDKSGPSGSKASSHYRRTVLKVLKKPFDREEYRKLSNDVKVYINQYPDLKKKLIMYRYRRAKRLTILRGFFFWIQNLTREDAFRPWKDRQCIAVDPESD